MNKSKINPSLAIGVVIANKNNEVLLVQEKRDKYYEKAKGVWGLPAGKVEWTESIKKGLIREIKEELNITVKPIGLIGIYQYLRDDSQCIGLGLLVKMSNNKEKIKYNENEIQDVKWMGVKKILNSNMELRFGVKEVLKDYEDEKNIILPFKYICLFDLRNK